jgi:hypothetical protein
MTPGGAGLGPCLTAAAPEAAPEVSFASKPLRRCPNAYRGGQRGLLSRWVHADLRETWRPPDLANADSEGCWGFEVLSRSKNLRGAHRLPAFQKSG